MNRQIKCQREKAIAVEIQSQKLRLFIFVCFIIVLQFASMTAGLKMACGYAVNPYKTEALADKSSDQNDLADSVEKIVHALTTKFNWFDASSEAQYREALLAQLKTQQGNAILISNDMNKFAQFHLMMNEATSRTGLIVELQEASFDDIFEAYKIDKNLWPEIIRRFNLEGIGSASTESESYTMIHDYQNGSWVLSVETKEKSGKNTFD